ncbi:dsDNA nuclease domain-containing protein [Ligilactobacillus agilis]|uniref:dsDNA nuclease domain-containing protein n=1 Tax=Ligilactobacillus agilis TaxID=1601 RepID=UPI00067E9E97|nr:dsDNA nuclease domain-containing protein [Ligilactobacillus agilis]
MSGDNGGAVAQKGFNYQTAAISLVAIRNYRKDNFMIFVEADEDFEVTYDKNYHAYIQVKGHKNLTLNKLLKSENGKPSILEKNLDNGTIDSHYKIVVYNFSERDLKKMIRIDDDELFEKGYHFSENQKNQISNAKSDNLTLVITDFKADIKAAEKFLIGEMHNQGISVDKKADSVFRELNRIISQKAEIIITKDAEKELKKITANELQPILMKVSALERFDVVLEKFHFFEFKNEKIRNEKNKLFLEHSVLRDKVISDMRVYDLEEVPEEVVINDVIKKFLSKENIEENTKYAICISAYCNLLEEVINE